MKFRKFLTIGIAALTVAAFSFGMRGDVTGAAIS